MDEIGWTQHWLTEQLRADYVRVDVARSEVTRPRVRIRAIEAKGRSSAPPAVISRETPPWDDACEQVRATLDSLRALYELPAPDAFADLRFTAFCEHLFSVAISRLAPLTATALPLLITLSALSARTLQPEDVEFDSSVVATFFGSLDPALGRRDVTSGASPWPVLMIRASGAALTSLLTGQAIGAIPMVGPSIETEGLNDRSTRVEPEPNDAEPRHSSDGDASLTDFRELAGGGGTVHGAGTEADQDNQADQDTLQAIEAGPDATLTQNRPPGLPEDATTKARTDEDLSALASRLFV
jgi:hypothetical protein